MPRVETVRAKIIQLLRAVPFQPFALSLENGEQIIIGRPENLAYDPPAEDGTEGSEDFAVLTKKLLRFSTFAAVTTVTVLDRGQVAR